jgi:hypothetical protein
MRGVFIPNMDRILIRNSSILSRTEFPRSLQLVICAVLTGIGGVALNQRISGTFIAILFFILAILNIRTQSKQQYQDMDEAHSPFDG